MTELNEQLLALKQQLSKRKSMELRLNSLEQRRIELKKKLTLLSEVKNKEQVDVERLEKGGIVSFLYSITGKKEQKLELERQEAATAKKEYDAVRVEYDALLENIDHYKADLERLSERRAELDELLNRKKEHLRAAGADMTEIDRIGAMLKRYENQLVEIDEALILSEEAHETAKELVATLQDALDGAVYDLQTAHQHGGSGKYECLDSAKVLVDRLQVQLKNVRSELVGVDSSSNLNVEIGEFTRYIDRAYDGLLIDKLVLDKIRGMYTDAKSVREKLDAVVHRLRERQDEFNVDIDEIRNDYERLIIEE